MANDIVFEPGYVRSMVVTDPAAPNSGDPVRVGKMTGVAMTKIAEGGNDATHTTVNLGPFTINVLVKDDNTGGIAYGDAIFYEDSGSKLTNLAVGTYFFGIALGVVTTGAQTVIEVLHCPTSGAGAYAALGVSNAMLADGVITQSKLQVGASGAGLTGLVAKFVATGNVIGGIPVVHHILMVAGANGDTDITLTHKTRLIDVIVHPRTTVGSAVVTVKNVTNAITDAMVAAVTGVNTHAASIAIAYDTIAAGTVLRATGSGGATQPDCDVYVIGERVA